MSLEEKENGMEQENTASFEDRPVQGQENKTENGEAPAPVKKRAQNRRPSQRRTSRPKKAAEGKEEAAQAGNKETAEASLTGENEGEQTVKKEQPKRAPRRLSLIHI